MIFPNKNREAWLLSLKAGDKVAVAYQSPTAVTPDYTLTEVVRVTKTKIVTRDREWKRENGERWGRRDSWSRLVHEIVPYDQSVVDAMRRQRLLDRVKNVDWDRLDTEALQVICDALRSMEDES